MHKRDTIIQFLKQLGQEQLIPKIRVEQEAHIYKQILAYQKRPVEELLYRPIKTIKKKMNPPQRLFFAPDHRAKEVGEQAIQNRQVHAICLAAGLGSRLQFDLPKALYPLTPNLTLLDYHLSKIPSTLSMTLFCSDATHAPIEKALPSHYPKPLVQENLPFYSASCEWLLDSAGIVEGPDGNGSLLDVLAQKETLTQLKKQGVLYLVVYPIDNPLLKAYDPELIGRHILERSDVTIKCFEKTDRDQSVGLIGEEKESTHIIDYHHLRDSSLKYANANQFCFSIEWLENHLEKLPIHWVPKTTTSAQVFKGERFITDLIQFASRVTLLAEKRSHCFAPLKRKGDLPHILEKISIT